jgi:hypothetical protein
MPTKKHSREPQINEQHEEERGERRGEPKTVYRGADFFC